MGQLTEREQRLLQLADRADAYIKQEMQERQREGRDDRPDNFGDVSSSRRDAFQ